MFSQIPLKHPSFFRAKGSPIPHLTTLQQTAQVIYCDATVVHLSLATQASGCQQCDRSTGCGAALMARLWPRRQYPLIIPRERITQSVQVGDTYIVHIDQARVQRAVIGLYALPLAGLMFGTVIGAWLGDLLFVQVGTELTSIMGGLFGFGMGLMGAKRSASAIGGIQDVHISPKNL